MLKFIAYSLIIFNLSLSTAFAQRFALVIGNSSYKIGKLSNPVNDADDMAALLSKKGFQVKKLRNANRRIMNEAISTFTTRLQQANAVGLFYFAGHGIEVDGRNYLVPIGANINSETDVQYEGVDAGRVMGGMEKAKNNLNMVILDACRNNPYERSFRGASRGLQRMGAKGSLVLYATSSGDVASDGGGRNGLFTQHLMQAINTPNLKVEDVYKNTADGVYHATNGKQFPTSEGGIVGKFYFSQSDTPTTRVTHNANVYLTVKTSPAQARVRILNIAPKYQAGIRLKTAKKYQIEVSYQGYQSQRGEVSYPQGGEQVLTVLLQPLVSGFNQGFTATPATTIGIKQPPPAPVKKMFSGDAAHFQDNQDGTATDTKLSTFYAVESSGEDASEIGVEALRMKISGLKTKKSRDAIQTYLAELLNVKSVDAMPTKKRGQCIFTVKYSGSRTDLEDQLILGRKLREKGLSGRDNSVVYELVK